VSASNPRDAFLNDLQDILECLIVKPKPFIILGDFNIHWDVEADRDRMMLADMAETFRLMQHVT
jgi:exonuclease III